MTAIEAHDAPPLRLSRHARERVAEMEGLTEAEVLAAVAAPDFTHDDPHDGDKRWYNRGAIRVLVGYGRGSTPTVVTVIWKVAEDYARGEGHSPRPESLRGDPAPTREVVGDATAIEPRELPRAPVGDPYAPLTPFLHRAHAAYWAGNYARLAAYTATLVPRAMSADDTDPMDAALDALEAVALTRARVDALEYEAIALALERGATMGQIGEALGRDPADVRAEHPDVDPRWKTKASARRAANAWLRERNG